MARKLRIAASVFFGLATVALCVLWVQSHHQLLVVQRFSPPFISQSVLVFAGQIRFNSHDEELNLGRSPLFDRLCRLRAMRVRVEPLDAIGDDDRAGFLWERFLNGFQIQIPIWPMVLVLLPTAVAMIITLPVDAWRFSLRTMLIATTLVAVVLGLAVWAVR